jgi:hypothetical protein
MILGRRVKMDGQEIFGLVFIGSIILAFGLLCVDVVYATHTEESSDNYIISLKDTMSFDGRFALGSGVISGKPSFVYYNVVGGNGYQLKSVPADHTGSRNVNDYKTKYEIHVPKDTIVKDFNLDSEK